MLQIDAALIAQGPFEVAPRYRGPPPADVRKNATGFDNHFIYSVGTQ
jgi:hypothetical protein